MKTTTLITTAAATTITTTAVTSVNVTSNKGRPYINIKLLWPKLMKSQNGKKETHTNTRNRPPTTPPKRCWPRQIKTIEELINKIASKELLSNSFSVFLRPLRVKWQRGYVPGKKKCKAWKLHQTTLCYPSMQRAKNSNSFIHLFGPPFMAVDVHHLVIMVIGKLQNAINYTICRNSV